MHRKPFHDVGTGVHGVLEQSPASLGRCHVTGIKKVGYLIEDFHVCSVRSFVCVLVQILHGFNGGAYFDVQMAFEFFQQPRIVGDHPTIVTDSVFVGDFVA